MKIRISDKITLTLIQVYAPTQQAPEEDTEKFYNLLNTVYNKEKTYYTAVMGDYNVKIGINREGRNSIGKFAKGITNENRDKATYFAEKNNLKLISSFLKKKKKVNKWTWRSPDGLSKNEIDHFFLNDQRTVKDVGILVSIKFSSDYRMGRCHLKIPLHIRYRKYCIEKENHCE